MEGAPAANMAILGIHVIQHALLGGEAYDLACRKMARAAWIDAFCEQIITLSLAFVACNAA